MNLFTKTSEAGTMGGKRGFIMYHIIINPASRSGRGLKIWKKQIEPALRERKISYRSYFSNAPGEIADITAQIFSLHPEGLLRLIILGGDGTVNEALSGMRELSRVVLGYIPTGSSNDLARALKLPKNPLDALDLILKGANAASLDLGCITYADGKKRLFAVSCGVGFDAAVCREALHSPMKTVLNKLGLGKLTYLVIALKQLLAAKKVSCQLSFEDRPPVHIQRLLFVTCMIHPYEGGGFMFCPGADAQGGLLSLCAAGDIPKLLVLFALPTAFWGRHYFAKGIEAYQAASLQIQTTSPLWVHTDGEVTQKSCSFSVSCLPKALRLIVP